MTSDVSPRENMRPESSQRPVRVGIVGLGFGLQVHLPAFAAIHGCRVVAIAGRNLERAAAAAAAIEGVRGFASWREMLDAVPLDAVTIAVPPVAQPEIVCEAASRGIAVFCEKPAAATAADAERMLRAVSERHVAHAINFLFPEIPVWQAARTHLSAMTSTDPLTLAALAWRVETYAHRHRLTDSWKCAADQGGGALNNFVSHSVYCLEWLFGPVRRVLARLAPDAWRESRVEAWLDFESGLWLTMSVALNCPLGSGHRLEVYGADGALTLENTGADYVSGFRLTTHFRGGPSTTQTSDAGGPEDGRVAATSKIAARFIHHLRAGGLTTPNLEHGLRVCRLLECLRASHQSQTWVEAPHGSL